MALENPFQPPSTTDLSRSIVSPNRNTSLWLILNLTLFVAAFYNALEFNAQFMGTRMSPRGALILWILNLLSVCAGGFLIWLFGLGLLERLSLLLRGLIARRSDRAAWQDCLYEALKRAAILSIPGAILWIVWVFAFYRLKMNFFVISWVVGVPAHVLGAAVYVPLLLRWYKVRSVSRSERVE